MPTAARRGRQTAPELTPEDEASLLTELGQKGATALQYTGELLDKPAAAARGILSGLGMGTKPGDWGGGLLNLIPFSDTLGITDPEKRIQPADLTGLKPESSDDWATWGGKHAANLGVGVLTDPLFWATSGLLPAVSRSGQALKATGLMGKGVEWNKILGKVGRVGPREGMGATTARQYLEKTVPLAEQSAAFQKVKDFAQKFNKLPVSDAEALLDTPIGGNLNIGLWGGGGRKPWATLGGGSTAGKAYAKGMDWMGAKTMRIPGMPWANSIFNQAGTLGIRDPDSQASGAGARFTQAREAGETAGRSLQNDLINITKKYDLDNIAGRNAIRRLAVAHNPTGAAAAETLLQTVHGVDPADIPKMRELFGKMSPGELLDTAKEWGVRGSLLDEYLPREAIGAHPGAAHRGGKGGVSATDRSGISRNPALRDISGEEATVNEVFANQTLADLADTPGAGGKETRKSIAEQIKQLLGGTASEKYLTNRQLDKLEKMLQKKPTHPAFAALPPGTATLHGLPMDDLVNVAKLAGAKPRDRANTLAKIFMRTAPESRKEYFNLDPAMAIAEGRFAPELRIAKAKLLVDIVSMPKALEGWAGTSGRLTHEAGLTLDQAAKDAGIKFGDMSGGLGVKVLEKMGLPADERLLNSIKTMRIRPDLAEQLGKFNKSFDAPESVSGALAALDKFNSFWKSGVTTRFSFAPRNIGSGTVKSMLDQVFSAKGSKVAWNLLHGSGVSQGDLSYVVNNPVVKAKIVELGLNPATVTAPEAANILATVMHTHWGTELGGMSDAGEKVARTVKDLLEERPGTKPITAKSVVDALKGRGEATWNPRQVGVGEKKGWAPFEAGRQANRMAEAQPRLTSWLKLTSEGYDPAVAADIARTSQFRYSPSAFTKTEKKVLKRLIPFYPFQKQSLAATAKELVERPGGPLGQLVKTQGQMSGSGGQFVPDYIRQSLSLPIPEGTPLIGPEPGGDPRFMTGFGLMHEDPFGYLGGGVSGAALDLVSRTNPLLKGLVETATNRSTFQRGPGGPRELSEQDPLIGRLASNLYDTATGSRTREPPRMPQLLESIVSNSPASAWLSMSRTLFDPRKSWTAKALNTLTGARVTDVPERTSEGITGSLLTQMMKEAGGRSFENVYFSKQQKAAMSPDQLAAAERLEHFKNMLAKKQRARAKAAVPASAL
jgi:uncharacterized protein YidB (DUF937 family)